jgi:hypothetical protein
MPPYRAVENLVPDSDLLRIERQVAPVADAQLANPQNALCLFDGEWITLNASRAIVRASDVTTLDNPSTSGLVHPLFSERGAGDVQASPGKVMAYITGPSAIRLKTRIYDPAKVVGSGLVISGAYGQGLKVATISLTGPAGTRNFTGLVGHGGSGDSHPVVARVLDVRDGVLTFQYLPR